MKCCLAVLSALMLFCGSAYAADDKLTVWFDAGGSPGEPYARTLQNGAQAAADALGVDIIKT